MSVSKLKKILIALGLANQLVGFILYYATKNIVAMGFFVMALVTIVTSFYIEDNEKYENN